jgi:hypothetical protein
MVGITLHRLSDSEILGSVLVSGSPRLIAAAHVLHRLPAPRHPPYALCSLTVSLRHTSEKCSQTQGSLQEPQETHYNSQIYLTTDFTYKLLEHFYVDLNFQRAVILILREILAG